MSERQHAPEQLEKAGHGLDGEIDPANDEHQVGHHVADQQPCAGRQGDGPEQPAHARQGVASAQAPVQAALAAEDDADARPDGLSLGDHIQAKDLRPALAGQQDGAEDLGEGGLAGPVGTQQAEELALPDLYVDVLEGEDVFHLVADHAGLAGVGAVQRVRADDGHGGILGMWSKCTVSLRGCQRRVEQGIEEEGWLRGRTRRGIMRR